jgi:hypothetical protein
VPAGGIELLLIALVVGCLIAIGHQVGRIEPRRGRRRRARRAGWLREAPLSREAAERRSLDLLRSVVNPDEWDMFTELGFICVTGRRPARSGRRGPGLARYRYLIYPHLPVVALLPRSLAPVREYCVQFPDLSADAPSATLPTGDDVLAKWMTLRADEDRLLAYANVCNAGCQVPLGRIERDIRRYERWVARRALRHEPGSGPGATRTRWAS